MLQRKEVKICSFFYHIFYQCLLLPMELLCLILYHLLPGQLNYLSKIWQNDEHFFNKKGTKRVLRYFASLKFVPDVEAGMVVLRLSNRFLQSLKSLSVFGKFKLNLCIYCSLLLYFLDCFVYNQCITFRLNKPKHSGDETKRSPFLNTPIMHFCWIFACSFGNYFYLP